MSDFREASLWRDYNRGLVGFQLEGKPRRVVPPGRARDIADELEGSMDEVPGVDKLEVERFIDDLREYADDVEAVGVSDE